jgi:peptide deformylase
MALRDVLKMGDPRLLVVARSVEAFDTPELHSLVTDLLDTMVAANGAGLAAPQIGVDLAVVIFGFDHNERYPEAPAVPRTVLVNPQIEVLGPQEEEDWEGCLSVPGMRGWVPRWKRLRYWGCDENGLRFSREVSDFHARVVQHECDHLDGVLYPMRIRDMTKFGFNEALFPGQDLPAEE